MGLHSKFTLDLSIHGKWEGVGGQAMQVQSEASRFRSSFPKRVTVPLQKGERHVELPLQALPVPFAAVPSGSRQVYELANSPSHGVGYTPGNFDISLGATELLGTGTTEHTHAEAALFDQDTQMEPDVSEVDEMLNPRMPVFAIGGGNKDNSSLVRKRHVDDDGSELHGVEYRLGLTDSVSVIRTSSDVSSPNSSFRSPRLTPECKAHPNGFPSAFSSPPSLSLSDEDSAPHGSMNIDYDAGPRPLPNNFAAGLNGSIEPDMSLTEQSPENPTSPDVERHSSPPPLALGEQPDEPMGDTNISNVRPPPAENEMNDLAGVDAQNVTGIVVVDGREMVDVATFNRTLHYLGKQALSRRL